MCLLATELESVDIEYFYPHRKFHYIVLSQTISKDPHRYAIIAKNSLFLSS